MECIPQCTTKTITEPSEAYYIFSEADSTQAFEGFKGHSESKSGYWVTEYDHPLKFDLMQKVFVAATNATPHAYLKNIMDTYFSFCTYDATSIDDSFAAMDIPAFNGQSVAYVFRFFDILKTRWWWVEKTSLIIHWDDGTTDGGKHIRFGTEPVIVPECIPQDPVDAVTIIGGYLNGTKLTSTAHATTPGSVEIVEKFPSIVTQALLDTMSAAGLAMWGQAQIFYTVGTGKRGLHQYGNTCTFDSGPQPKFDTGSITAYIHGAMYDLVEKTGKVTLGVYLSVPSRPRDKVQETLQLIDNVEQHIHWTWRDPAAWDFLIAGLTDNTNFNDLDVSAIVGVKKMLVSLRIVCVDNAASSIISIKTKGQTNAYNSLSIRTNVSTVAIETTGLVETDSNGILSISCTPKPTDWTGIYIGVRGYKDA